MRFWDVNLWVYAFRQDSPFHGRAKALIEAGLRDGETFLFAPEVASSFLRIVTNPRIFKTPASIQETWSFIDVLKDHPQAVEAKADGMLLGIFKHMSLAWGSGGNDIPDLYLASLAIRHDAVLHTADRSFNRIQGLRVEVLEG